MYRELFELATTANLQKLCPWNGSWCQISTFIITFVNIANVVLALDWQVDRRYNVRGTSTAPLWTLLRRTYWSCSRSYVKVTKNLIWFIYIPIYFYCQSLSLSFFLSACLSASVPQIIILYLLLFVCCASLCTLICMCVSLSVFKHTEHWTLGICYLTL